MNRFLKISALCLVVCFCLASFISCGEQKTMMTLEDKQLSVNVYEFLLSRMKGTLGFYGYDITSDSFWRTVVSADGSTYDDYFCGEIRREAACYLIADHLFDEYGLTLSVQEEKAIDDLLASHESKAGSRAALNEKLKMFGVNYEILREIYVTESKIINLKEHLYGKDAQKVLGEDKQKFLDENYVCFEQISIPTYYYVTDLDRFGDTVYYTDKEHTAIAYDKQAGKPAKDETGKYATDIFGKTEYYTEDGKIAYDMKKGVIGYLYERDEKGNYTEDRVIEHYDDEKKGHLFAMAKEYAAVCNKNPEKFEQYSKQYGDEEQSGEMYLFASAGYYASLNSSVAYFDDIAEELTEMDVGECRVVSSDYGYHVIFKKDNAKSAYDDKELYDTCFTDFSDNLITYLWGELCAEYLDDVVIDESVADIAPNMKEVGANVLY